MLPRWPLASSLLLVVACGGAGGGASPGGADAGPSAGDAGPSAGDAAGCVPAACPAALACGTVPDGCGGEATCGPGCAAPQACGGGGAPNQCGCAIPDADGDGHPAIACGGDDCDDGDASVHPGAVERGWTSVTLGGPTTGASGYEVEAATDPAGALHVAFHWRTSSGTVRERLRYVRVSPAGAVGAVEDVHASADPSQSRVGRGVALALDPAGAPHVTFGDQRDTGATTFFHGVRGAAGWTLESPAPGGERTALALGADGIVHAVSDGVRYHAGATGALGSEPVADGSWPAVALAPDGRPHVVFETLTGIRHAVRDAAGWTIDEVDAEPVYPGPLQVAFDAAGALHVVYQASTVTGGVLRHARLGPGGWAREVVGGTAFGPRSLLVLPDGRLAVASLDQSATQGITIAVDVRGPAGWTRVAGPPCGCADVALVERAGGLAVVYGVGGAQLALASASIPDGIDHDCDGTAW